MDLLIELKVNWFFCHVSSVTLFYHASLYCALRCVIQ